MKSSRRKSDSLVNTVSFTVRGSDGIALLAGLDMEGICASSGSACSAGSLEPSHVVLATGRTAAANSLVRFSLGRDSTRGGGGFGLFRLAGSHPARTTRLIGVRIGW